MTIGSQPDQIHAAGEIITPAWVGQAPDEIAGLSQINFESDFDTREHARFRVEFPAGPDPGQIALRSVSFPAY